MAIQLTEKNRGKVLEVEVSGRLVRQDYKQSVQKGMSVFCKTFTTVQIRYSDCAAVAEARAWLEQS